MIALGANPREVKKLVASLPGLEPFKITVGRVKRRGIVAARARVTYSAGKHSRDLRSILSMIRRSRLSPRIKEASSRVFTVLGEAEGKIHGVPAEKVHFHEVGAVDSIVDIVGSVVALSLLGFPELYHRPLHLGSGTITFSHGTLPLPAPATLEVLKGRIVIMSGQEGEVVTPTGAALVKALAAELPPGLPIRPVKVVYTTGTREEREPGMLRAVECDTTVDLSIVGWGEVTVLETTIDDMTPELFGHVQEKILEEGALDIFMIPVSMKKNRPGILITVLCETSAAEGIASLLFNETTTIGLRVSKQGRLELKRRRVSVKTRYGMIDVKLAMLPDDTIKAAPEYESCKKVAWKAGVPVRQVFEAATAAALGMKGKFRTGKTAAGSKKGGSGS
jgi:uncharacterized protein (TIGR00299 family) protein